MNNIFIKRLPQYGTWYHIVETLLPTGKSRVVGTVCSKKVADEYIDARVKDNHIQNILYMVHDHNPKHNYTYSIDPVPISEPLRRCDVCNSCSK